MQWGEGYYNGGATPYLLKARRYYDSITGRFLSRDPIGYAGGIDLYAFADNDPVNEVDPSGLDVGWASSGEGDDPYSEAGISIGNRLSDEKIAYQPNRRGSAPRGADGKAIELHHRDQSPTGPVDGMEQGNHRGPGNMNANHPNGDSDVDHGSVWRKWVRRYWSKQWDNGRFKGKPKLQCNVSRITEPQGEPDKTPEWEKILTGTEDGNLTPSEQRTANLARQQEQSLDPEE